ncbi:MAG: transcription-repair coupling factor, partial [Clostridiales bacterium]|nr:transcription-repair coupling factor [Clostridiales bacterium]
MKKELLLSLEQSKSWKQLIKDIEKKKVISTYGMADGQRSFLAAAIAKTSGKSVIFITPNELQAARASEDIAQLLQGKTALLPVQNLQFGRGASSHDSAWRRLETLSLIAEEKVDVLCVASTTLMSRHVPKADFKKSLLYIKVGEVVPPSTLIQQLLRNGYERVDLVEGKGQCAARGSIVDVYPPNKTNGIRIEFFDDEIDSIRAFDIITQRSMEMYQHAVFAPATEVTLNQIDYATAHEQMIQRIPQEEQVKTLPRQKEEKILLLPKEEEEDQLPSFFDDLDEEDLMEEGETQPIKEPLLYGQDDLSPQERLTKEIKESAESIKEGYPFRKIQNWIHILHEETVTIANWMPDAIIMIDSPDQVQDRIESHYETFLEEYKTFLDRYEVIPEQRDLLFSYEQIFSSLSDHHVITLSAFLRGMGHFKPDQVIEISSVGITPYHSNITLLAENTRTWLSQGYKVMMFLGSQSRGKRLQKNFQELELFLTYSDEGEKLDFGQGSICPINYHQGFIWDEEKLVVITDKDIYGEGFQRRKSRKKAGEKISSFTDLKEGDYVVHESHGVGIYQGTISLVSEGIKRDYIYIQYQGNDKLYVPVDQMDRVQRYIGAQGHAPKINRLSGGEWEKQKSKVKAGIKAMAFDLAKLYAARQVISGFAFSADTPWQSDFEDNFPYELTQDQELSVSEIKGDMESSMNMDRLLCGDVGYGKTEVAVRAAFKAVMDGKQVAILAPTTILVQQHFNTISKRLEGFPVNCDYLSRFKTAKEQRETLSKLSFGEIDIIIGTHRLLGKDVAYKDLGLLIIDEEQRFGVGHKEVVKNMKKKVDVLSMSATPIPRTLHMSMIGIRDMSILETPPEERFPIQTHVVEYNETMIRDVILREINRGGQVYFLYNRVKSIERFFQILKKLVPEARIGIAHGQMREQVLEDVMLDFYNGNYDVLLCTTIIESGLDVPTANTLIVFDADRFGLSQLYQLRGRVGRSNRQAYTYFTVRANKMMTETAQKRLSAIREFTEFGAGFRIAMRDLEIRGAGNVLGPEQHGQLSTVGYDMYVKLMEETMAEVRGEPSDYQEIETKIELRLEAYLPENYIEDS